MAKNNKSNVIKRSVSSIIFDTSNIIFMVILGFIMLYPFYNTIIVSFNNAQDTIRGPLTFWPRVFSTFNYETVFRNPHLQHAAFISVARTVLGTVINVILSALLAYVLSFKDFVLRRFLNTFLVLTMYVSAGLIPTFFLYRSLGLVNSFWVYILPSMVGAFNVIVIRTYIRGLPDSFAEAAKIDGAGELRIFVQIIFPLCKPVLATIALWVAVGQWNSWFDTYIFAPGRQELSTLQYEMMKILASAMVQPTRQPDFLDAAMRGTTMVTPNSLRAAITVVATLPIIVVYPFLQKYFIKGLHLGGVKG